MAGAGHPLLTLAGTGAGADSPVRLVTANMIARSIVALNNMHFVPAGRVRSVAVGRGEEGSG
ncbi:hypothetical protein [Streptomyces sp. NPDC003393]